MTETEGSNIQIYQIYLAMTLGARVTNQGDPPRNGPWLSCSGAVCEFETEVAWERGTVGEP